tara:strand:+ start:28146 stop:36038 length:7893 start_codon:yes stop_codon:yes gene_type:complete
MQKKNPSLFSPDQLDEMKEMSTQLGVEWEPYQSEFDLIKTVNKTASGFLEGFTTIATGSEPKNTYEAIAHSLGHLAGFAPGIIAAPLTLGAKALAKTGFTAASKKLLSGAQLAGKANHWSVPMMAGGYGQKVFERGLAKAGAESLDFMKKGAATRAITEGAVHLGVASGVSSIWKGPDVMMDSMTHGAVFGGAFGGLGNFRAIGNFLKSTNKKNHEKGEQMLKGAIGAGMMGAPAYLRNDPIEMVLYETLLGGFFGYQGRPAREAEGGKFIQDAMYGERYDTAFNPSAHPKFKNYSKGAQEYIYKQVNEYAKKYVYRNMEEAGVPTAEIDKFFVGEASKRFNTKKPNEEQINTMIREEAQRFYTKPGAYYQYNTPDPNMSPPDNMKQADRTDPTELTPLPDKAAENKSREQETPVYIAEFNPDGTIAVKSVSGEYGTTRVGEKRVDRPADTLENTKYGSLNHINLDPNKPISLIQKPLDVDMNGAPILQPKDFYKMSHNLDGQNMYIFGGVKDKGVLNVRPYHIDATAKNASGDYIVSTESIVKAFAKGNPKEYQKIKRSYQDSLNAELEFYGKNVDKEFVKDMHHKAWRSNVLAEAERNGYYETGSGDLSKIHNLTKDGHSKNVIDWNKREQIYHDKSIPLNENAFNGIPLNFTILRDLESIQGEYKNEKGQTKRFDSDTDGTVVFEASKFDKMMKDTGLPENVDMNKPVIVFKLPEGGTVIAKSAGKRGEGPLNEFMKENNLDVVMFSSSTKHRGNIEPLKFDYSNGKYNLEKINGEVPNPIQGQLQAKDIRINYGTYVNPKSSLKAQRIVRQLGGNLNEDQAPGIAGKFFNEINKPSIEGTKEMNTRVEEYFKTGDESLLKDIHVEDMSTKYIHRIFTRERDAATDKIARHIARQIAKMDKAGELENVEDFSPEQYQDYIYRNNRILDVMDFSEGSMFSFKPTKTYWDNVYKKYMINRYIAPKYKYSMKGWLSPKLPHTTIDADVKAGTFRLGTGAKDMNVIINGNEMKLGEAWKKHGKSNPEAFEFIVVRVPMDSISGARVLKFDGFSKDKGFSVLTNAKDNVYLGGADKDSDSAFIYQGFSKDIKDAYRKNQNEWETSEGYSIDGKSKSNDKLFEAETESKFTDVYSKFSPSFRKIVAQNVYKGQRGLGFGLTAKKAMVTLADTIAKEGGEINTFFISKNGKQIPINIKLKEGGMANLRKLGREIVNRSADAADYSSMTNFKNFRDILFNSAFEAKIRIGKEWKKANYNHIKKSELGVGHKLISLMDPKVKLSTIAGKGDRLITFEEFQNTLRQYLKEGKAGDDLTYRWAKQMREDNLTDSTNIATITKSIENLIEAKPTISMKTLTSAEKAFVRKLTQLHKLPPINPQNILKMLNDNKISSTKIEELISKDMFRVASQNALTNKGYDIFKAARDMGIENPEAVLDRILDPISRWASEIKQRQENRSPDSEEILSSRPDYFDTEVAYFKLSLNKLANRYDKIYGKENKITRELLHDYFDHWLMSPFYRKEDMTGPFDIRKSSYANYTLQSQQVSSRALKQLMKEYESIFQLSKTTSDVKIEDALFKVPENYKEVSLPKEKIEMVSKEIIERAVGKSEWNLGELRRRAISDKDLHRINELEKIMEDYPQLADNFNDYFQHFTLEVEGAMRDMSTLNMRDVGALTKYFKDANRRFGKRGQGLPDNAWRVSVQYLNEQMALQEGKFFGSFEQPVKTSDGVVKKKVKEFTGTIGIMKEWMRRVNLQQDAQLDLVKAETDSTFSYRNEMSTKDGYDLHKLVVERIESNNPNSKYAETFAKELSEIKSKLKDKVHTIGGKKYTTEELVTKIARDYNKDLTEFANKWIHAKDKSGEHFNWDRIDKDKDYSYTDKNGYLRWNKDGSLDIMNFIKKALEPAHRGLKLDIIPIELIHRFQYEYRLEKLIKQGVNKDKSPEEFRNWFRSGKSKFQGIGLRDSYFPHLNFGWNKRARRDMQSAIDRIAAESDNANATKAYLNELVEASKSQSGFGERHAVDELMISYDMGKLSAKDVVRELENIGFFHRESTSLERKTEMPGWEDSQYVIDKYKEQWVRSHYKNLGASMMNRRIDTFVKEDAFGKHTKDWADFLRIYARDSFGHPTTFSERIHSSMKSGDPLKLKGSMYYNMSDAKVIEWLDSYERRFSSRGWKAPFLKEIPPSPNKSLEKTDPVRYKQELDARKEYLSRFVHDMGALEARYQLLTLLANTGTMTANMFGGTTMTITSAGMKNFLRANNTKFLDKFIWRDKSGNKILKLNNGSLVGNKKELRQWIAEQGVIDSYINDEFNVNLSITQSMKLKGKNINEFKSDLIKLLKKNIDARDETILELARRHGVQDVMLKAGGFFMRASERRLRTDSFITHAIAFKERFGKHGMELRMDDPAVIKAGLAGVEATQFLYHSAFRPAYMRTALGKVMTRFKLFAFQSVRTRKEFYRKAKLYGFKPGTDSYNKFKNLFVADMMTMALGAAFAYSLFDTALPPPWDWMQETGQWLFGDKREREKAFFAQYPYPIAPLQVVTPPIARLPMSTINAMMSGDWERFMDYHIHTMYPFGRVVRQFDKTIDEPYGSTLGRGMQQFFRLPGDNLVKRIDKAQLMKQREDKIKSLLEGEEDVSQY